MAKLAPLAAIGFIVCTLALSFGETHAQGEVTPTTIVATPTAVPTMPPLPTATPNVEVLVLQAQLEQMRATDSQLLDAIYWSLGLIGGFTLLLIGYSWITNRWQYDRDKALIRQEILAELRGEISEYKSKLDKDMEEMVRSELSDIQADMEALARNIDYNEKAMREGLRDADVKVYLVRAQLAELANNLDEARQLYDVVIYAAEKGSSLNRRDNVTLALEGLQRVLKKGLPVNRELAITMKEMLRKVPDEHREDVRYVAELIKEAVARSEKP